MAILVTPVALPAALIYSGRGKLVVLLGVVLLLVVQLAAVVPRLFPTAGPPVDERKPKLTVMSLHVGDEEVSVDALLREVRELNVDVLALPELNPRRWGIWTPAGLPSTFLTGSWTWTMWRRAADYIRGVALRDQAAGRARRLRACDTVRRFQCQP